jgi:predicted nucleic acid-binding protein
VIIVDSSAVVSVLTDRATSGLLDRLVTERSLHAPDVIDVEVTHALRRLARMGRLSDDRAADARVDFTSLRLRRYRHVPLLERTWELRHALSAYDGVYVALAEALGAPLVTCDARLARATGHEAKVELFAPA